VSSDSGGGPNQKPFTGRLEKCLPASIPIYLANLQEPRESERTSTENASYRGVRVISKWASRPGQESIITTLAEEVQLVGRVIYCLRRTGDRFSLGVEFPNRPVKWTS
jgi:hypothetical protein